MKKKKKATEDTEKQRSIELIFFNDNNHFKIEEETNWFLVLKDV